jgi:hypothetical protein
MMEREMDAFRLTEVKELDRVIAGRIITCISSLSVWFCNYFEQRFPNYKKVEQTNISKNTI